MMIQLNLPWPPKELSPNNRTHYQRKAKAKAKQRSDCYLLAKQVKVNFPAGNIPITIIFHPPNKIKRDLDNLLSSCKGMLDGVADSWGIDDTRFRPITIDFGPSVKGGSVVLNINS